MACHWMLDYNDERPHDSLGNLPPSVYRQTLEDSSLELSQQWGSRHYIRALVVVDPNPVCRKVLHLLDAAPDVLVQPVIPDSAVIAFDICVLLWFARLDVL